MLRPGPKAFQHNTTIATIAMSANRYITWLTSSNEVNPRSRRWVWAAEVAMVGVLPGSSSAAVKGGGRAALCGCGVARLPAYGRLGGERFEQSHHF
ncbi:hypothetical protein GCM10011588_67820 [Nocardia jinanensis]|uniref:Uncharacterized protein n=1 Tax=Nocardia jinanensis TaxID=382504 RepID=A0A917RYW5_9NOCA|nr:hypothetical protein GCM10011588_67820 [Nocardia jinanensis]